MSLRKGSFFCINCKNEFRASYDSYAMFCSNKCHAEHKQSKFIKRWKQGKESGGIKGASVSNYVRKYLFHKYKNKCSLCGWSKRNRFSGTIPLIVDHKNGNSEDCSEKNLRLICSNCDSLTSTYKFLNAGKGRFSRRQRYRSGKSY